MAGNQTIDAEPTTQSGATATALAAVDSVIVDCYLAEFVGFELFATDTDATGVSAVTVWVSNDKVTWIDSTTAAIQFIATMATAVRLDQGGRPVLVYTAAANVGRKPIQWKHMKLICTIGANDLTGYKTSGYAINRATTSTRG